MLRIGVDVGGESVAQKVLVKLHSLIINAGTNTDGVLIDVTRLQEPSRGVLAHYKAPTTTEVSKGIENAVREVLKIASVSPSATTATAAGLADRK